MRMSSIFTPALFNILCKPFTNKGRQCNKWGEAVLAAVELWVVSKRPVSTT